MSLSLIRKPFVIQGLAFTVAALMMNNAQAASEQEQIQQLRDEVKELRALLEQYVPQSKQKNDLPQVTATPATTVVNAPNSQAVAVTESSQKSPLGFSTASGAQVKPKVVMAFSTVSTRLILKIMRKIATDSTALRQ